MPIRIVLMVLSVGLPIWGQDWQSVQPDTFYVNEKGEISIRAEDHFGLVFREKQPADYPVKFWVDANIYYSRNPTTTDAFFVFGNNSADSIFLWAAGYSLAQKHILTGKINIDERGNIHLTVLAKKPVEIIDQRNQNVYRLIFIHATNEIKIEVNGVPMLAACPIATRSIRYFGYVVKGPLARFEELRFDGK